MPAAREVRRRIWRELTDEERERLARVREQIAAELPEIAAEARARIAAIEETSFSGDLRRAIHASELSESKIAERSGIRAEILRDFMCGHAELDTDQIDRIAGTLNLTLTATIEPANAEASTTS